MEIQELIDFLNSLPPSTPSVDLIGKPTGDAEAKALAKATHLSQLQRLGLGSTSRPCSEMPVDFTAFPEPSQTIFLGSDCSCPSGRRIGCKM